MLVDKIGTGQGYLLFGSISSVHFLDALMEAPCARGANVNESPFRGTPLTYATADNQTKSVRWLLAHGTDPNLKHDFGGEAHGRDAVAYEDAVGGGLNLCRFGAS